ncbi:hypothetical protein SOVF_088130 isoform C [Spinacia oleracea]|nr:hypothetical protein SOVF_088130 isoform C [Spinacia oleracea]
MFLTILSTKGHSFSWGWFSSSSHRSSSSSSSSSHQYSKNTDMNGLVAEFSIEALDDPKAVELLENTRMKLGGSNPCWFYAYKNLFSSCSEIFAAEEKRSRLAWLLSDCFQRDSGGDPFPSCNVESRVIRRTGKKATEVEKEVTGLGEELSSKLKNLQGKADDIADMVGVSIQKQQQLLASESEALLGIQSLTDFQSKALQESRVTLQQIVGFAQGQHQELKQQQEHLLKAHNLLAINSSYLSIL